METAVPFRRPSALRILALVASLLLVCWAAIDWSPERSDLRAFDPAEVARLETAMWRSYYEEHRASLFAELGQLMRTQYHFSWWRSYLEAAYAARAAFVFKRGHNRAEYEKALPSLVSYYEGISRKSTVPFDPDRAARFELEWWIVHREVSAQQPQALYEALANLQACVYRASPERFKEHARFRGEAMLLRDQWGHGGGVSEEQWQRIRRLLESSWSSLHAAVERSGDTNADSRWCPPS